MWSGSMSGGKPVSGSGMYSPNTHIRCDSNHIVPSCPREEMSCSRTSRTRVRAGQVRVVSWKDSGPVSHRGQVGCGFSSNQEGSAAR